MESRNLIVFGSTSSIAKMTVPYLGFHENRIYYFDRSTQDAWLSTNILQSHQHRVDFGNVDVAEESLVAKLEPLLKSPCVILNFMGSLGAISRAANMDISEVLRTSSENLVPFLIIAKAAGRFPGGSSVISFSGAGIGGDNLDDSSLGYLSAKASMAILAEVIDNQLKPHGIRFGLIAPGAFPSRMQKKVAEESSSNIPITRILAARKTLNQIPSPEKLIATMKFLIEYPDSLGGRVWSANYDELSPKKNKFGKLRRTY